MSLPDHHVIEVHPGQPGHHLAFGFEQKKDPVIVMGQCLIVALALADDQVCPFKMIQKDAGASPKHGPWCVTS